MPDLRPLLLDAALTGLPPSVHEAGEREAAAFALALQDFLAAHRVDSRLFVVERQTHEDHGERLPIQSPVHVLVETWNGHWDVRGRHAEEAFDGSYVLREISRAELMGYRARLGKTQDDYKMVELIGQVLAGRVFFPDDVRLLEQSRQADRVKQGSRGREEERSW